MIFGTVVLLCAAASCYQFVSDARAAARQSSCNGSGCASALTLNNYVQLTGRYPPATVTEAGHVHSWRARVIATAHSAEFAAAYRFDEPWNSEANWRAAATGDGIFSCSWDRTPVGGDPGNPTAAAYVALVGPECVIRPEGLPTRRPNEVPERTIVLVETRVPGIPWTKPFDLSFERLLEDRAYAESVIGGPHPGGGHFVRADGTRGRINEIGLDALLKQCVVPDDVQ